ncbi:MAG: alpha/beta hydrolase [Planctomycetota bacterium]|nr:alpha/beta hydrolase [Planctomycetota bacterium]MDA1179300.1 alpha/beta hydrolase [Planctomycetota bacterium]
MPLHPQSAKFLEQYAALGAKRAEHCTADEIRANMRAGILRAPERFPVSSVTDRQIEVPDGKIPVRIYRATEESARPVLMFIHGGGWVAGDIDTHDLLCRAIAHTARSIVVSVDYRLAPEHKFPTAAEDCYAAIDWTFQHATTLGGDPHRISVAGDSAGGNLAAVVCMMARDRGSFLPRQQILIYPITDSVFSTGSYEQFAEGHLLTRSAMQWFWDQYTTDHADREHPYVAPLRVEDLTNLPPALVITAECDVLRDEGEAYARRLQEAGVPTTVTRYDGMLHGFAHRVTIFDAAQQLIEQISAAVDNTPRR